MQRKWRIAVAVAGALITAIIVLDQADPAYVNLLFGRARLLPQQTPLTVDVSGRIVHDVRCFVEPGGFRPYRSEGLVLRLENPYTILIVDLDHGDVQVPNCCTGAYKLLWNRWLIQSDLAAVGVSFDSGKLGATADPNLQRSGNVVSFTVPAGLDLPSGRWKVTIDSKSVI